LTAFDRELDDNIAAWRNVDGSDFPILHTPLDSSKILQLVRDHLK
jgi:hypothetical protein